MDLKTSNVAKAIMQCQVIPVTFGFGGTSTTERLAVSSPRPFDTIDGWY